MKKYKWQGVDITKDDVTVFIKDNESKISKLEKQILSLQHENMLLRYKICSHEFTHPLDGINGKYIACTKCNYTEKISE